MQVTYKDAATLVAILNQQQIHLAILADQQAHPMAGILAKEAKEAHELAIKIRDNAQFAPEAPAPVPGLRPLYPGESPRQG
jgi:hypothetical protein